MQIKTIAPDLSVSSQLTARDVGLAAAQGFRSLIVNRPDGESADQPGFQVIAEAAERHGLAISYVPVVAGNLTDADVVAFAKAMEDAPAPALAYCRTGTRSATLWALSQAGHLSTDAILRATHAAGYDLSGLRGRLDARGEMRKESGAAASVYDIVIVGGGAAGISTAASILKRRSGLKIAIIEPRTEHYYQPGWTLVGGGVFNANKPNVKWRT